MTNMTTGILLGGIVLVVVALAGAAGPREEVCVSKRLEELERRLSDHEDAIQGLQRTVAGQQSTIQIQNRLIQQIQQEFSTEQRTAAGQQSTIQTQNRLIQQIQQELRTERQSRKKQSLLLNVIKKDILRVYQLCLPNTAENETENKERRENGNITRRIDPATRASIKRQERAGIAFSAFLDHNIDTADHQTVRFNQIITNEGNGYNNHTGVFTCPEAGTYLFIFSIGERGVTGASGVGVRLVVNSVNIIDAEVDAFHVTQNVQGGNAVILRLKAGDVVWVDSRGGHVVGSVTYRFTSFSGVFLYP